MVGVFAVEEGDSRRLLSINIELGPWEVDRIIHVVVLRATCSGRKPNCVGRLSRAMCTQICSGLQE